MNAGAEQEQVTTLDYVHRIKKILFRDKTDERKTKMGRNGRSRK